MSGSMLVLFEMAPSLSWWVRFVPPVALLVLAMMAAICPVRGPALHGLGPVPCAATLLVPRWDEAPCVRGPALARAGEEMDEAVAVSEAAAALCAGVEVVFEAASFGAAAAGDLIGDFALAGKTVGVKETPSADVYMPDFEGNSSRDCEHLRAECVCSPVCSFGVSPRRDCVCNSGALNLLAAFACAFCFQPYLDAMLAALFFVPGLLFKGVGKDKCKKKKRSSSFLPGKDLTQASCSIRGEGHRALESAELVQERQEIFNIDEIRVTSGMPSFACPLKQQQLCKVLEVVPGQELLKRMERSSLGKEVSSFS